MPYAVEPASDRQNDHPAGELGWSGALLAAVARSGQVRIFKRHRIVHICAKPRIAAVEASTNVAAVIIQDDISSICVADELGVGDFDCGVLEAGLARVGDGNSPEHGEVKSGGLGTGFTYPDLKRTSAGMRESGWASSVQTSNTRVTRRTVRSSHDWGRDWRQNL